MVKSSSRIWKVVADAATEHAVEQLARRENRTLSNICDDAQTSTRSDARRANKQICLIDCFLAHLKFVR
jgi:hypothetical protein